MATATPSPSASPAPARPPRSGLAAQTVNDQTKLSWTAPASGTVRFYRIYRDGTEVGYSDRYDRTSKDETTYSDTDPGTASHRYWVTAVDSSFNESLAIGPVTWPAG